MDVDEPISGGHSSSVATQRYIEGDSKARRKIVDLVCYGGLDDYLLAKYFASKIVDDRLSNIGAY